MNGRPLRSTAELQCIVAYSDVGQVGLILTFHEDSFSYCEPFSINPNHLCAYLIVNNCINFVNT